MHESKGVHSETHVYVNGSYVAVPYFRQEYPKVKYGTSVVTVNNADEEAALGEGWFDSPAREVQPTIPGELQPTRTAEEVAYFNENGHWPMGSQEGAFNPDQTTQPATAISANPEIPSSPAPVAFPASPSAVELAHQKTLNAEANLAEAQKQESQTT